MDNYIIFLLIGYTLVREIFFQYQTHKLLNKLMSRNYHEFKYIESNGQQQDSMPKLNGTDDGDLPEDLGVLSGIG